MLLVCGFIGLVGIFQSCTKTEGDDDFSGNSGTFTDKRDDAQYKWVKIGNQIWMAENLAYLPSVSPSAERSTTEPYYYIYAYQGTSVSEAKATEDYNNYGVLFNWTAAKKACPTGWHLPSDEEWKVLEGNVDGEYGVGDLEWNKTGTRGFDAGKNLKAKSGWDEDGNGTDNFGFSGVPGGRQNSWYFDTDGYSGWWWTSTIDGENTMVHKLASSYTGVYRTNYTIVYSGLSIRCVRND